MAPGVPGPRPGPLDDSLAQDWAEVWPPGAKDPTPMPSPRLRIPKSAAGGVQAHLHRDNRQPDPPRGPLRRAPWGSRTRPLFMGNSYEREGGGSGWVPQRGRLFTLDFPSAKFSVKISFWEGGSQSPKTPPPLTNEACPKMFEGSPVLERVYRTWNGVSLALPLTLQSATPGFTHTTELNESPSSASGCSGIPLLLPHAPAPDPRQKHRPWPLRTRRARRRRRRTQRRHGR